MNSNLYTATTCAATSAPDYLKRQYGNLRYNDFAKDDPYVEMNHRDKTEFDKFDDRESTVYVFAHKGRKLLNAMRLIPTTEEYDIQAPSWNYLTDGIELPQSKTTYCAGRWVGQSTRELDGLIGGGLLMMEIHRASQIHGFDQMFGVTTSAGKQWFDKRQIPNQRLSSEFFTGREKVSIFLHGITVGDAYLQVGKAQYEIGIEQLSRKTEAVA